MNNTEDLLEQIRLQSERPPEEMFPDEFNQIKKQVVIDRNAEYPDPEYLIEIGGVPTIPKGNLVALSAKWKNGKTFFCDILTAVFLGSGHFANCRSRKTEGRVLFFDTEQAESDTCRIRKTIDAMIPESRHDDYEVSCLRSIPIDKDMEEGATMSRMEFIMLYIERDHPDLVIIDGIADLIYNYNDVFESQKVVNKLAALANKHNCAILVVMHQNKGMRDKNMKGHLGTMLFQKCSDVFEVEKHGSVFVACHSVSRHRNSGSIAFKLDANAVPMDATADRQLQAEMEKQQSESEIKEMLADLIPDDGTPVKRKDIVEQLTKDFGLNKNKSYDVINYAIQAGFIVEVDRTKVKINQ